MYANIQATEKARYFHGADEKRMGDSSVSPSGKGRIYKVES